MIYDTFPDLLPFPSLFLALWTVYCSVLETTEQKLSLKLTQYGFGILTVFEVSMLINMHACYLSFYKESKNKTKNNKKHLFLSSLVSFFYITVLLVMLNGCTLLVPIWIHKDYQHLFRWNIFLYVTQNMSWVFSSTVSCELIQLLQMLLLLEDSIDKMYEIIHNSTSWREGFSPWSISRTGTQSNKITHFISSHSV